MNRRTARVALVALLWGGGAAYDVKPGWGGPIADGSEVAAFGGQGSKSWGKDPFGGSPPQPSGGSESPSVAHSNELQGIIAGPTGMVAIVGNRLVRIGDQIGTERVLEITPRAVILQRGQQTRRLIIRTFTAP